MTKFRCITKGHAIMLRLLFLTGALLVPLALVFSQSNFAGEVPPEKSPDDQRVQEERVLQKAWRKAMRQVPQLKRGCFKSSYPKLEWQEVPCKAPPSFPMTPRRRPRPFVVGNGNNVSAVVPTASFISSATGSFDSITGVTSLSSTFGNAGLPIDNAYSLQVNTNRFASTACDESPNPDCRGFEQFLFVNDGSDGYAHTQYWLTKYNTTCPVDWNQFSFDGDTDIYCWRNNSNGAVVVPNQPVENLGQLILTGTVNENGDSVDIFADGTLYTVSGDDSVNAAEGWIIAEFGVFGAGGGSEATFNNGSTIVPRTRITYGGQTEPICFAIGFTGETNNLNFESAPPTATGPGPAILSTQSSDTGVVASCAAATTVGDTHLTTFGGLLYDFQASGDFVLAKTGPDFVVQARQISGAPRWPNTSVNSAVATQMGNTNIAICLEPERLVIDSKNVNLDNGKPLALPDGVDILRNGNIYLIRGQMGDSVRAVLHDGWMNVTVGLGRWPVEVHGLLFNTKGLGIETSDGEVLQHPISFKDLYYTYGDSWRVPLKESLLSACGDEKIEQGNPEKPFYAKDLDPKLFKRVQEICIEAGVKEGPLLNACALDVAVIGNETAAKVFATTPAPVAVAQPTQ